MNNQINLDNQNAEFWSELCGSSLALSLGISEINIENLNRFDIEYMKIYPYLHKYIDPSILKEKKILEIGLGYGTIGQKLSSIGGEYFGIDISEGPVKMMKYRVSYNNIGNPENIQIGSALNLPFEDQTFDFVYSIGCLHHTGNIKKAVTEIYRVLKKGGYAIIMLYNRNSFRRLIHAPIGGFLNILRGKQKKFKTYVDAMYDQNLSGDVAPCIEYVTLSEIKQIFNEFSEIKVDKRNFDEYNLVFGLLKLRREFFLNNFDRIMGLDLYIVAKK